jgi:hypothetical protein
VNHDPNCHHGMIPRKNSVGFDQCPVDGLDARASEWVFEPADPEVGILTDGVTHTCPANLEDPEPAEHTDTRIYDGVLHPDIVDEVRYFTCPVCKGTTTTTDQWPRSYFVEPGRE